MENTRKAKHNITKHKNITQTNTTKNTKHKTKADNTKNNHNKTTK